MYIAGICLSLLVWSCRSRESTFRRFRVATSIFPIFDMASCLAGEDTDLFFTVPPGANPHTYEPVPSVVKALKDIDLFIASHPHLDSWVTSYVEKLDALKFLFRPEADQNHPHTTHSPGEKSAFSSGLDNPHQWLSVNRAHSMAEEIASLLIEFNPVDSSGIRERLKSYQIRLDSLSRSIDVLFGECKEKRFFQWHPAWDYFAQDHGLYIAGTIEQGHGDQPSARAFSHLIHSARRQGIRIVVVGLHVESRSAVSLVREIGGRLVRLDTIGDPNDPEKNSYMKLMMYNARTLAHAFKSVGK